MAEESVLAPGARVVVRDEEWLVRTSIPVRTGGYAVRAIGMSEVKQVDISSICREVYGYPSESMAHLMLVAGRAMRSAPGKERAHIIQVRDSELAYHFEQRWLYQDISDRLRPQLNDTAYCSKADLVEKVDQILAMRHVDAPVIDRIHAQLESLTEGMRCHLLLTGLPFDGSPDLFDDSAPWGAVFVTEEDRERFCQIFNGFSDIDAINDNRIFLNQYLTTDTARGSEWKSHIDMLASMDYARI